MKIVQMIYSLSSGGAEKFVVNLSNELAEMGHEVCVCVLREESERNSFNRQFLTPAIRYVSLGIPTGFSFRQIPVVEKFLEDYSPDVVHCHLNVIPFIFRYAFFHRRIRYVYTFHNIARYASGSCYQVPINGFYFRHNLIMPVAISKLCRDSYVSMYKNEKAVQIDNGAPQVNATCSFHLVEQEVVDICNNKSVPVFVHVARFHKQKNQALLIDAFNRLAEKGYDFRLLVIGQGFLDGEGYLLKLKSCDKIVFLGEKANVGDYLLNADAFCLSSEYEGLPISLLESMSCGITPVCTAVGGIPDVIEDGINGYLVSDFTVDSYCDALIRYIEHPIDKTAIINSFQQRFSMSVCAGKYLNLYTESRTK